MLVAEIMQRDVMTVVESDLLESVLRRMLTHGVRHAPVLRAGKVVGVVSERNLLGHRARYGRDDAIGEIMTAPAYVTEPTCSVANASAIMTTHKIGCLPVLNQGDLVGIVTRSDLLATLAQQPIRHSPWGGLTASDVMARDLEVAHEQDNLLQAALKMLQRGVRHLPVVDGHQRLIGMLSDRDLRGAVGDPALLADSTQLPLRLDQRRVAEAMTCTPAVADLCTPLAVLAQRLSDEQLGALPIVDQERRLLGIVSYVDVLRAMLKAA